MDTKLYELRPAKEYENKGPWDPWYDCAFGFVVRATDEQQARLIASKEAGCEEEQAWLDHKFSTCVEVGASGECAVIIRDFAAG